MRRWLKLAARLYPRAWRERYGEEFDAVLQDYQPGWREFANVIAGALSMQITSGVLYWKTLAAVGAAGALLAASAALMAPRKYVSSVLVQLPPRDLERVAQHADSDGNLDWLVFDPKLDLYPDAPYRRSEEDALADMRRNTRIEIVPVSSLDGARGSALKVTFSYPDKAKAEAAAARIAADAVRAAKLEEEDRARYWPWLFPRTAPPPAGPEALVLPSASAAAEPRGPAALRFAGFGAGAGLMAGALALFAVKRTKRALMYAAFAAAGAGLALAVASLIPARYTSTAVLQLDPPMFQETKSGAELAATMRDRFEEIKKEALDPWWLGWWLQGPRLRLYPAETVRKPIDQVVEAMLARDLSIQTNPSTRLGRSGPMTIRISFTYPDPKTAQVVVREMVSRLTTSWLSTEQTLANRAGPKSEMAAVHEYGLGDKLELLDQASLPSEPVSPNRLPFVVVGLAGGLLLCILAPYMRRIVTARRAQPSGA